MTLRETFDRDGLPLALHIGGTGAPWVFQHGLCGAAGQPLAVAPEGYAAHVLEMRGHGESALGPPDALSIATFADDLAAMITARGIGPCPVGGISMGAAIALRLAVTRPDLVSALVLARPAWALEAAPDNMSPNAEVGRLLATMAPDAARTAFLAGETAGLLRQAAPDNLASLTGFFGRTPQAETAALLTAIAGDGPGVDEDDLKALTIPVLIIATGEDHIHPLAHARRLATLIDHATLAQIPAKSTDPAGYTSRFRATLTQFLKGL